MAYEKRLMIIVLLATLSTAFAIDETQTYSAATLAAAIAGTVGAIVLLMGLMMFLYDFTCRNYAAGTPAKFMEDSTNL